MAWKKMESGRYFDLKLEKPGYPPFEKKGCPIIFLEKYNLLKLPEVNAVTVNEISTRPERIQQLSKKYEPCSKAWRRRVALCMP